MRDKPTEKFDPWLPGGKVISANALKGELLIAIPGDKLVPRNDGKQPNNFRLVEDETLTVYAEADDIAPLSDHDFLLLVAIECSSLTRYEVFISNKLEWGQDLKQGDGVFVTIQGNVRAAAIIRFIGMVTKRSGLWFGVEIMVRTYE